MLPFLPLLKDKRVASGSNMGQAQQLSLRKEKKGYFSNAALMLYFPVGSLQTLLRSTCLLQNTSWRRIRLSRGLQLKQRLSSRRWHNVVSWDLLFGRQLPCWTFFPPSHGHPVKILRGVWVTLPEAGRSIRGVFPWDITNQSRSRRWGWKGQGGRL